MMQNKTIILKLALGVMLTIILAGSYLIIGVSSQNFTKSACACGTVNMVVVMHLNELDALVQQYAAEHSNYPTYDELIVLVTSERVKQRLTPQINFANGAFTFTPTRTDASRIGYAVSVDRQAYVLIGIGLTEKHRTIFFYGREVWTQLIGYEFPILYPGDTPPTPSPIQ